MSSIDHFDDLQEYVNSNPLPVFEGSVQQDMTKNDKSKLDFVALYHLPQNAPDSLLQYLLMEMEIVFQEVSVIF